MQSHTERLNTFATGVAAALTGDWTVTRPADSDRPSGVEIGSGERTIHLLCWANSKKVQVLGAYPTDNNVYLDDAPSIKVGVDRDPAGAAKDIERRFLPAFEAHWQEIARRVTEANDAAATKAEALAEIKRALHVDPNRRVPAHLQDEVDKFVNNSMGANFKPNHNGSTFEVRLQWVPRDLAVTIAKVIADAQG